MSAGVVERECAGIGGVTSPSDVVPVEIASARVAQAADVPAGVTAAEPPDADVAGAGGVSKMLASLEPGPAAMAYLHSLDAASLSQFERVEVMQAWETQHAWVMAQAQPVLVAVASAQPTEDDWEACEVAAALHLSGRAAAWRIETGRTLCGKLPATLGALGAGAISWRHAQIIAGECADLPVGVAAAVEARVLGRAGHQTPGRFGAAVRRAITALRPAHAELSHQQARQRRHIWLQPEPDGMATLGALLPAETARAIYTSIDAAAHHTRQRLTEARARGEAAAGRDLTGHRLTIDELRADAFAAAILGTTSPSPTAAPSSSPATSHADVETVLPRMPTEVHVVIDLPTLLGLADHPGELAGYGPIPAGAARMLAADAAWRRFVVDPVRSHLLDYGRATYRPPKPLADFVRARDGTCRFPGCGQPARRCDLDHTQPYAAGGATCPANTCCLCRRHHRLKTHAGWKLALHEDGACTWTSPAGHHYYLDAAPQLQPLSMAPYGSPDASAEPELNEATG